MGTVYIHIGLPKTATTFLQGKIFPEIENITFFDRDRLHEFFSARGGEGFRSNFLKSPIVWNQAAGTTLRKLASKAIHDNVLISEENISANARFFDFKARRQQDPVVLAHHLARMRAALLREQRFDRVKVLVTIRRQDTWIASRYAQSGLKMEKPSQENFERLAKALINTKAEFHRSAMVINYRYMDDCLREALGKNDVCFLPMESIQSDSALFYRRLVEFFDGNDSFMAAAEREKAIHASNAEGENRWKVRQEDGQENSVRIEMPEQLAAKIMRKFAKSNEVISKRYDLGLDRYGYF
ncbi:hypothetical protein X907_2730 [Glycocaulis alkaliphilus]|uniref:Uncharacterized protein n=1 Tax=Glycocaulis alkaliphilus TaxID=1434191 RepID=A0A3T0ED79_9PROT|nr:hypothetical protein [Glycocaulis alkaliphilus]AZU05240.1 hypothetical protein X907_2730 [Glycocaulis alkaliphilus]GGB82170.1 hypothetical protein GCM10007417_22700 [Glycocaulis alkaliphilus]